MASFRISNSTNKTFVRQNLNEMRLVPSDNGSSMLVTEVLSRYNLAIAYRGTAPPSFSKGDGVIYIQNAEVVPTGGSAGGGLLYCEGGALIYRGAGGTLTTIGAS